MGEAAREIVLDDYSDSDNEKEEALTEVSDYRNAAGT